MEFHDLANIFPLDEEHLDELAADIKRRGLAYPIETLDGKILDGRRRWLACKKAGIKPTLRAVNPDDPIGQVISANLHRRHLSVSQIAMVADRTREAYDKRAKDRQREHGNTAPGRKKKDTPDQMILSAKQAREELGDAFGISGATVDRARQVRMYGIPGLGEAVLASKISLNKAATIASHKDDPSLQRKLLAAATQKKPLVHKPKREPSQRRDPKPKEGEVQGVGVDRANEAINCLRRIPKNDRLRKRGFQIVSDWIRHNK